MATKKTEKTENKVILERETSKGIAKMSNVTVYSQKDVAKIALMFVKNQVSKVWLKSYLAQALKLDTTTDESKELYKAISKAYDKANKVRAKAERANAIKSGMESKKWRYSKPDFFGNVRSATESFGLDDLENEMDKRTKVLVRLDYDDYRKQMESMTIEERNKIYAEKRAIVEASFKAGKWGQEFHSDSE